MAFQRRHLKEADFGRKTADDGAERAAGTRVSVPKGMTMVKFDFRDAAVERPLVASLVVVNSILCCLSLAWLAPYDAFHILYDGALLPAALLSVTAFAVVGLLFIFVPFSFGYFVGFHFYMMVLGYLWVSRFSDFAYDHRTAEISAAISAIAFLAPALLIRSAISQRVALSETAFEKLLTAMLALGAAVIAVGAIYSFRIVSLMDIYNFRSELQFPTLLNYMIGITSTALLPFVFACYVLRSAFVRAAAVLLLLLLFYPITLSKSAFFAPFWLVYITVISWALGSRVAVLLSLTLPILVGIILMMFFPAYAYPYHHIVNLRLFAIPSNALDFYNDFFAHHPHTYFCQISFLKSVLPCPYHEPLSVLMQETYHIGFFNASLLATEGIASVGLLLAPVSALVCGLVIALANSLSAGLPARFVLISGALFPVALSNIPLTTVLLTHGAGALFLLWYVMPRDFFSSSQRETAMA
jgi:hypothetical protein